MTELTFTVPGPPIRGPRYTISLVKLREAAAKYPQKPINVTHYAFNPVTGEVKELYTERSGSKRKRDPREIIL